MPEDFLFLICLTHFIYKNFIAVYFCTECTAVKYLSLYSFLMMFVCVCSIALKRNQMQATLPSLINNEQQ